MFFFWSPIIQNMTKIIFTTGTYRIKVLILCMQPSTLFSFLLIINATHISSKDFGYPDVFCRISKHSQCVYQIDKVKHDIPLVVQRSLCLALFCPLALLPSVTYCVMVFIVFVISQKVLWRRQRLGVGSALLKLMSSQDLDQPGLGKCSLNICEVLNQ